MVFAEYNPIVFIGENAKCATNILFSDGSTVSFSLPYRDLLNINFYTEIVKEKLESLEINEGAGSVNPGQYTEDYLHREGNRLTEPPVPDSGYLAFG